jgi:hypothetical protein
LWIATSKVVAIAARFYQQKSLMETQLNEND